MKSAKDLRNLLETIDHRGYPAYKETAGAWRFESYILCIDHVQGDPFAAPSRLHVELPLNVAGIPGELYDTPEKKVALEDHLLRRFYGKAGNYSFQAKGSGKSGVIAAMRPGQEVIQDLHQLSCVNRTAVCRKTDFKPRDHTAVFCQL